MLFEDDWCTVEKLSDCTNITIRATSNDILEMLSMSPDEIKYQATKSVSNVVGNNPVLCLSGGLDSQAMINLWHSDFPYTAITFEFAGGLNADEVNDAKAFAEQMNIPLKIIKLDVMRFLTQHLIDFGGNHGMSSPQFSTLAYFLDNIKTLGYTGAVLGGDVFSAYNDLIKFGLTTAQLLDMEMYSQSSKFPVISSFLSFNKLMCLFVASRQSPADSKDIFVPTPAIITSGGNYLTDELRALSPIAENSYPKKIKYYENLNLKLRPQCDKKTGFEQLKSYYNNMNNNQWAFERDFRFPLYKINPNPTTKTLSSKDFADKMIEVMTKYSA